MTKINAVSEDLPSGSFAEVGTYVNTLIMRVWKDGRAQRSIRYRGVPVSTKPASRLICKAVPRGDKFAAQFALPGLVPYYVRRGEKPVDFETEREAHVAAMEAVLRLYDSRTVDTRKAGGYRRLTGAELGVMLDTLDVTVTYFAEIAGVPQHRVMKWLDGEQDIPHSVHVLARLMLASDENFRLAEEITEQCQER